MGLSVNVPETTKRCPRSSDVGHRAPGSPGTVRPHIPPSMALELQLKSTMPHGCDENRGPWFSGVSRSKSMDDHCVMGLYSGYYPLII